MTMDPARRPNRLPWPPLIYLGAIVAAVLLGMLIPAPLPSTGRAAAAIMGAALIAGSLTVDIWSIVTLLRGDTTAMPHKASSKLVTTGPFRFSRNPIYLANTALTVGLGLVAGNLWFLAAAFAAAVAVQELAIKREERHLGALFGSDFSEYCQRVRRWI